MRKRLDCCHELVADRLIKADPSSPDSGYGDQLVYVNNVLKGKLLESEELMLQAANNSKAQFSNSPTLTNEIMNAIIDALTANQSLSKQALDSAIVGVGLKDVLLGPRRLCEALRERAGSI